MSLACVSSDFGTMNVLREQDVLEKLDRKLYKAGRVIAPSISSMNKVVVVSSGTVEIRVKGRLGKLVSLVLGGRCVLRTGDYPWSNRCEVRITPKKPYGGHMQTLTLSAMS
mmetsp:Transcript_30348/g.93939  ORF Transcript_30348/g.93939 Transcript_30348/m.93939 type:complete len:111 (-) Transcript_30348:1331-1663(-)